MKYRGTYLPVVVVITLAAALSEPERGVLRSELWAQNARNDSPPVPHGQDQIPNPPRSAAQAVAAMIVPPGFHVEVVATEPDIVNPVAMTFDERGRAWITESLEYPRHQAGPGRDRIKILDDTDGDGKADKFTIFADGLNIPSGIAVGHGGVWVANSPDILFMEDCDGDGKADHREVVATGFGRSDTHELPNSLTWGPDGWLYGWNGVFNPSTVKSKNGQTYKFTCAIFRIHPRTRVFEVWCEGTSNPWGIAINPEGSFFSSACVIDHLWHLVETGYYIRQGGPYPPFTWPIESIVDHEHQKAAYCGIHYFDSPAYPAEFRGRLYMGNIHGNGVNVDLLERNGSTYKSKPAADFLRANDAWFMPVAQKTGPDGCLYILDWYDRYHCYQDANRDPAGIDRLKGRLYRVAYGKPERRAGFNLAEAGDDALLKLLASANVYDRDTAQRLLTERGSAPIRVKLERLVLDDRESRSARMHALWALNSIGPLDAGFHGRLLSHRDPSFRAWGVRAAGDMKNLQPAVRDRLLELAADPSADVRLQVAIASRKIVGVDPLTTLLAVLQESDEDPLIPQIVWQNLHPMLEERQHDLVRKLKQQGGHAASFRVLAPHAIELLLSSARRDAAVIGAIVSASACLEGETCRETIDVITERFREGFAAPAFRGALSLELSKVARQAPRDRDSPYDDDHCILLAYCGDQDGLAETRNLAALPSDPKDRAAAEEIRIRAVRTLLHVDPPAKTLSLIERILKETEAASSLEFRGLVVDALGACADPELARVIINAYTTLPPDLKPRAIELLTERPAWSGPLLAAIDRKQIPASAITVNAMRKLQRSQDRAVATHAKALFGIVRDRRNRNREHVVEEVRSLIRSTPGDPGAGRLVFGKLCAQCHKIHGEGQDVGPDITSSGRNDFEQLLSNVFDPSLVIGPGYQATTVATTDGRVLTGLLAEDGQERIVLKVQGGKQEIVPRGQIDEVKTSALSLMPEEMEKQFTTQEIADLFAFLCLDKPPTDPTARALPGSGPIRRPAAR